MKNKILFLMILAIFTLTACNQTSNTSLAQSVNKTESNTTDKATVVNETNKNASNTQPKDLPENECKICNFDFANYKGELKKEEVEGLLLGLNDEYMATAIYEQINKDFNNPRPFVNIVQAEIRHSEKLKSLFTTYKIPIPENPWTGNVPKFKSVAEACKAGVDAEIINKQLYDKLFKSTAREDILTVYRALQRASEENHLPAFERCGNGGGMRRNGF